MGVNGRYLSLPIEQYPDLKFGEANDVWIRTALELGEAAIPAAVERAGIDKSQLAAFFFVSVTGIASPSIDARLITRLRLSPSLRRVPIVGLGGVAGAAGISRAADYVRAYPDRYALLLSVELCSLTLQHDDLSSRESDIYRAVWRWGCGRHRSGRRCGVQRGWAGDRSNSIRFLSRYRIRDGMGYLGDRVSDCAFP